VREKFETEERGVVDLKGIGGMRTFFLKGKRGQD
jgi:hypothetical protein